VAIRLKDIARELDVSAMTVSKALRGKTDISEATRNRILKRILELDYQPNLTARSLATGQSYIIGLIVPDLLNPFFTEFAKSLGGALRSRSYGLILSSSEENAGIEQSEIRTMLARGVDALVLASCQTAIKRPSIQRDCSLPLVLIDRPIPRMRANFVGTDDVAGGALATEHLVQLGCKRIAYIGSPDLGPAADRFKGYRTALSNNDMALRNEFVLPNLSTEKADDQAGYDLMKALLKRRSPPDGVFCHNDVIAIGAMKAALDAGLAIPDDIALVGFDNVSYSQYLQIPLSSVDQRTAQLGEAAAQLVLDLVTGKTDGPHNILLSPNLVIRQSSAGKLQNQKASLRNRLSR